MNKKQAIQLFEERKVRTVWDDEQEKWFFCVVDVVEALTDSKNPTDYITMGAQAQETAVIQNRKKPFRQH